MKYNVNDKNLSNLFSSLKTKIYENKKIIDELYKIDSKYSKIKVNFKMLVDLISKFENEKIDSQKEQIILIHYNGTPYITLNLILLAITTNTKIVLDCNDSFLGINKFLGDIANNILKSFETYSLVYFCNDIESKIENVDKIICIDDINKYNEYLRKNYHNVKLYSYNYLDLYSDDNEYDELTELLYHYAEDNKIPVETYSELNINEAIEMLNSGYGRAVVLLTKNDETKKIFTEKIKNKCLYINENPFNKEFKVIDKQIFN